MPLRSILAALVAAWAICLVAPPAKCQTSASPYQLRLFPLATSPRAPGQTAQAPKLAIVVVEGEGAINNIKTHEGTGPVVRVEDENQRPVVGALVTFFVPNEGPGGSFAGGTQLLTVMTDPDGRAAAKPFKPNSVEGTFHIQVTASYGDQTTTASIAQSNKILGSSKPVAGGGGHGMSAGKIGLLVGVAAAGAVGAILGLSHGGSSTSSSSSSTQTATIGLGGNPTVGAPH
ncbi:MAG: hypothetical protein WB992_04355 [Bryobacteraceae bacterium]